MNYVDARILLSTEKMLSQEEAVKIIKSWQMDPQNYQNLLQTKDAAVTLSAYAYYSEEEKEHIFEETEKQILSPNLAEKIFELEQDDLTIAFLSVLRELTFVEDVDEEGIEFYAWPYLNDDCIKHFSAEVIECIMHDNYYVFNFAFDKLGIVYNKMYDKLFAKERCCDCLAINSVNQFGWVNHSDKNIDILAKHYYLSNFAIAKDEYGEEPYVRKLLVNYFFGLWDNFGDIVTSIVENRIQRFN